MLLHRISSWEYINDLSGTGSKLYGARWNEKGVAMVYFASSRPLSVLEVLVHLRPDQLQKVYCAAVFEAPDHSVDAVDPADLPAGWNKVYASHTLQRIGSDFIKKGEYLFLKVPSAIVPDAYNYLMNPHHPDASSVKLLSQINFSFDERLMK